MNLLFKKKENQKTKIGNSIKKFWKYSDIKRAKYLLATNKKQLYRKDQYKSKVICKVK
jgi:hypothetical protein